MNAPARLNRIKLAFKTSVLSKIAGLLVQVIAIPIAMRALGPERFGLYTMIAALMAWLDMGKFGLGPGLTRSLAEAWSHNNVEREQSVFSTAFLFLSSISALVIFAVGVFYYLGWDAQALLSRDTKNIEKFPHELTISIFVIIFLILTQLVLSVFESARSAYQEDYKTNGFNVLGAIVTVATMFFIVGNGSSIYLVAIVIYGSVVLAKLVNALFLINKDHSYLKLRSKFASLSILKGLLAPSFAFLLVQVSTIILQSFSLYLLGRISNPSVLTPFALNLKALQLLSTGILMITTPLWPAIVEAKIKGDLSWIRGAYKKSVKYALAYSSVVCLMSIFLGERVISLWSGVSLSVDYVAMVVMSLYFVVWMWNHVHTIMCYGIGQIWTAGFILLIEAIFFLVFAYFLVPTYNSVGMAFALLIAGTFVTGWMLPFFLRRQHSFLR